MFKYDLQEEPYFIILMLTSVKLHGLNEKSTGTVPHIANESINHLYVAVWAERLDPWNSMAMGWVKCAMSSIYFLWIGFSRQMLLLSHMHVGRSNTYNSRSSDEIMMHKNGNNTFGQSLARRQGTTLWLQFLPYKFMPHTGMQISSPRHWVSCSAKHDMRLETMSENNMCQLGSELI